MKDPTTEKKAKPEAKKSLVGHSYVMYQLAGGDVQAHVVVMEENIIADDHLREHSRQLFQRLVDMRWANDRQFCILSFVNQAKHFTYSSDATKLERLKNLSDDALEANKVVSELIRRHNGTIVRTIIVDGNAKGTFDLSSHLRKAEIEYLRAKIPIGQ